MMKFKPWIMYVGKVLFVFLMLGQYTQAKILFLPVEELVRTSEYIVIAKVITDNKRDNLIPDMTVRREDLRATVVKNELEVIELFKGSLSREKPFVINTLKFNGWKEDNVELPQKGSKVLLFLVKNEKEEFRTVNGIQGVWLMKNGEPFNSTTLEEIQEMIEKQKDQVDKNERL